MLERTSSCLEPASQLFLRRLDSPIRSCRALGPGFWRNGADQLHLHLHLPPWWPSDLTKVPSSSSLQGPDGHSSLICRNPLPPPKSRLSRFYTQHVALRQAGQAIGPSSKPPAQYGQNASQTLEANLEYYSHPQNEPTGSVFSSVKSLFVQVPNQADYAARVLRLLSRSSDKTYLTSALNTFDLIPFDQRSRQDYLCAVQAAIKSSMHQRARHINAEATSRRLDHDCSPILLLYSVSNQLWSLAAQVWSDSFLANPKANNARLLAEIASQVDLQQKLPAAILELGKSLKSPTPMTWSLRGLLVSLSSAFQYLLFTSGSLMSDITPKGLLEILDTYLPSPSAYRSAIQTLLRSVTRVDRAAIAMLVYHHLRSLHPSFLPPPALMGSLISIHCQEEVSADTLTYLLQEFTSHHQVADLPAYLKVLASLSKQGDINGTQSVFLELCRVHGQPKDPKYYSPLIYAYARVADAEGAESIFKTMENLGIEPNTHCWNNLLYAYVRASQPERALQFFQSMMAQQVPPDDHTFGILMSIHSDSGDTDQVLKVVELAQQYRIEGSYEMIAGVVHSYCLNDQIDTAIDLAVITTRARYPGSPVKMWNHILRYYAFHAESEKVLKIQDQMNELGVVADAMTYATFMTALIVIGKTGEAVRILRSLDIKQRTIATRFHYAIILQGYLLEGNRDMAQVIYNEMQQRFPDVGPSARLAMLRMKGQRSLEAGSTASVSHLSDYVADALVETSVADRATKEPQRGIGRRRNVDAFPSAFVEDLIKLLIIKGRFRQAELLLNRFSSLAGSAYLSMNPQSSESIPLLTARLATLKSQRAWSTIEEVWAQILRLGVQSGRAINASTTPISTFPDLVTTSPTSTNNRITEDTTNMIAQSQSEQISSTTEPRSGQNSSPEISKSRILFPKRFILNAAITRYLGALAEQKLYDKAVDTVEKLQTMGFALTSKNLNFYIQILTHSPNLEHSTLAFQLFERELLANTPPWNILARGKWKPTDPSERDTFVSARGLEQRKVIEKRNPDLLIPTYFTCVHLAMVLREFQQVAGRGQGDTLPLFSLSKAAPGTFNFIRKIPHLPDRIQSVLLRERNLIKGDRFKRLAQTSKADRSGILESQSPIDHVPVDKSIGLDEELALLSPNPDSDGNSISSDTAVPAQAPDTDLPVDDQNENVEDFGAMFESEEALPSENEIIDASAQVVARGEQYEGEINRSYVYLDRERRFEDSEERSERLQKQEEELMNTVQTMRLDLKRPSIMSNMRFGRPSLKSPTREGPDQNEFSRHGQIYNPRIYRLEAKALAAKRRRDDQVTAISDMADGSTPPRISDRKVRSIPQVQIETWRPPQDSKAPRGPYGKRSLHWVNDKRSPLDVKLVAKVQPLNTLPKKLLRAFPRNRAYRERMAFLTKLKEEKRMQRTARDLRLMEEESKAGNQELLYKTLDETVEMNRAMAEAAKVNQHELLQAQRLAAKKAERQRILKMYDPQGAKEAREAEMLAKENTDDDRRNE